MLWAVYKERTFFQIIYDVERDAKGEPAYTWVDLLSKEISENFFDTAAAAQHDYWEVYGDWDEG